MDYTSVTETTGARVTREAIRMMHTRYTFAAGYCRDKSVLEVACGTGPGLGYLARRASCVVGSDLTHSLLRAAHRTYGERVSLLRLDAEALPFRERSFDVVLLLEAIYYLRHAEVFLKDCRRVMAPDGVLIICTANRERSDFNPSPMNTRYFSGDELIELLEREGFTTTLLGAFPVESRRRDRAQAPLRRLAARLHVMPKTMRGKQVLKRLFLGRLVPVPSELQDQADVPTEPQVIHGQHGRYKVLYAVAHPSSASARA